jgi:hypothetical protein
MAAVVSRSMRLLYSSTLGTSAIYDATAVLGTGDGTVAEWVLGSTRHEARVDWGVWDGGKTRKRRTRAPADWDREMVRAWSMEAWACRFPHSIRSSYSTSL